MALERKRSLTQRQRKLIGTLTTVGFLVAYSLVTMMLGGLFAVGRGVAVELIFYIVAGLLWLPVVMLLIRWMSKPD